jgi:D-tyrosyl-tRNA(Tyr) deacylase
MRAFVQRVAQALVRSNNNVTGTISSGLLVLVGVAADDSDQDIQYTVRKLTSLRIFADSEGRLNLDVKQAGGSLLVISNFTLYGDVRRGNRPSFAKAAEPLKAEQLYENFLTSLRATGVPVQAGVFRTHMQFEMTADGPVSIWIDSRTT